VVILCESLSLPAHFFHLSLPQSPFIFLIGDLMSKLIFSRAPLSAAIILLSASMTAHAVENNQIEKVYVSGTRSESAQLPLATTITVIDQEQIRLSGATQVTEVLRTQAGIQIQDSDGSGGRNTTISMRGFGANAANNTLVIVDGRKLNNASLAGPALSTIAIKDIERIEIVQGSAGVLYGDQAVGGVINIVTRRAVRGEINGSVQAIAGSDNLETYIANASQGFENGLSYRVSAQKRLADNYRDNNQSDNENLLANFRFDFEGGHAFIEGQSVDDDLRLPSSLTDEQVAEDPRQTTTPTYFSNQETDIFRVGGAANLTDQWQLLVEYAARDEDSLSYYGFGEPLQQNLNVKNLTPRVVGRIPVANGDAVITVGYDKVAAEAVIADWGTNLEQDMDGYYGQVIFPVTSSLAVTAGRRYSKVEDKDRTSFQSQESNSSANELGLHYQINSAWQVFGRYAEGFRFANADENAYTLDGVDFLDAQTSESLEAGFGWQTNAAEFTLTAYNMDVDNEIFYDPMSGASGVNINLPESERKGVMLDANMVLNTYLTVRANYTYTHAELASGNYDGNEVPFSAENTANIALVVSPVESLTVHVDTSYIGSRYRAGDDANIVGKIDSLILLNANVLWTVNKFEAGFRVRNLTDEKYADYQGVSPWSGNYQYPQAGRTYEASLTYRF
jgi:iron complex outermembrane receptor protein